MERLQLFSEAANRSSLRVFLEKFPLASLTTTEAQIAENFSVKDPNGLFLARLHISGVGYFSGLVTALELKGSAIVITICCPHRIHRTVPLESILEFSRHKPVNEETFITNYLTLVRKVNETELQSREGNLHESRQNKLGTDAPASVRS